MYPRPRYLTPEPADTVYTAFDKGLEADREGCAVSENPYDPDSTLHEGWRLGWYRCFDTEMPARYAPLT